MYRTIVQGINYYCNFKAVVQMYSSAWKVKIPSTLSTITCKWKQGKPFLSSLLTQ